MSAKRVVNSNRSGLGPSSRSQFARSAECGSAALTAMVDLDHRTRSEPHDPWRWAFQPDANRESLRYAYPVERAFDVGNRAGQVDSILIHHPPANAVDHP